MNEKPLSPAPPPLGMRLREAGALLQAGRLDAAAPLCAKLVQEAPQAPEPWLLLGRLRQMQGDFVGMLDGVERAHARAPGAQTGLLVAEALFLAGHGGRARAKLAEVEAQNAGDYGVQRRLTTLYMQCGAIEEADRCARLAVALKPGDMDALYNLAPPAIALGKIEEAERIFDAVIDANAADWDAYYNRATLRKQTEARNHVDQLTAALARSANEPAAQVPLGYALSKELEDLGRYDESFTALARAASLRRRGLTYRVESDLQTMCEITEAFDAGYFANAQPGYADDAPIFVLGLPRSGTTLVDRILSGCGEVESRGELNDLALAVTKLTSAAVGKAKRVAMARDIPPKALGQAYADAVRGWADGPAHLLDKTPLNFLYAGLIAHALPNSRIVHVRRHPMAVGHAIYKTLFRMGYPFSYDLTDIGRYYGAYARLMAHWRAMLGSRLIEVDYENLVDDLEGESRRLVAACDLEWSDACLAFHENQSPSVTASAAQVRRPLYRDSRDLWRRYETQLAPLADALRTAGVIW